VAIGRAWPARHTGAVPTTARPWGLIAAGGAAGAGVRSAVGAAAATDGFPLHTFTVNLVGCLVLGALLRRADAGRLAPRWVEALGVGFCGGLTTFSTLAVEVVGLADGGRGGLAAAYVLASVVAGLAAFALGERLAGPA
jgi:fluoride exporter